MLLYVQSYMWSVMLYMVPNKINTCARLSEGIVSASVENINNCNTLNIIIDILYSCSEKTVVTALVFPSSFACAKFFPSSSLPAFIKICIIDRCFFILFRAIIEANFNILIR